MIHKRWSRRATLFLCLFFTCLPAACSRQPTTSVTTSPPILSETQPHATQTAAPGQEPVEAPEMETDAYAIWGLAIDLEGREMRTFAPVGARFYLYYDRTLTVAPESSGEDSDADMIRDWKARMPTLRDDTATSFLRVARVERPIAAPRLQTEYPSRPASENEMDRWLYTTAEAEPGAVGLLCVTDVGFSSDASQAMVLVHSKRVDGINPFQWLTVYRRVPRGWELESAQQVSLPLNLPLNPPR